MSELPLRASQRPEQGYQPFVVPSFIHFIAYFHHLDVVARNAQSTTDPILDIVENQRLTMAMAYQDSDYDERERVFTKMPAEEAMLSSEGFSVHYGRLETDRYNARLREDSEAVVEIGSQMLQAAETYQAQFRDMMQARRYITGLLAHEGEAPVN